MTIVEETDRHELLGDPSWIESVSGFPPGSWGTDGPDRPDPASVFASTPAGDFTGRHVADVVAFTEFLGGVGFDRAEREWLIDAMAREFESHPDRAMAELKRIAFAVNGLAFLDPVERADNRHKALTSMYQLDQHRERLALAENPVMAMVRARNPAVLVEESGVVVTADAVTARHEINRIVLALADRRPTQLPYLRTEPATGVEQMPTPLKAELAGSWIRLVLLRAWLADLDPDEFDRLRGRVSQVVDTATDLSLVGMMLSYRSMVEAMTDVDDVDDDDD